MAADVVPTASYLDLDDPFETSGSLSSKVSRPNSRIDGNESGELSDDSNNCPPASHSSSSSRVQEIDHLKRKERAKAVSNMWGETLRTGDNQTVRHMLDGPSAWQFGSPESRESGFRSDEEPERRDDVCMSPHVLRARSERLLTMDVRKIDSMDPRELRSYVNQAAMLTHEHDKLIDGRNKLFSTMLEMYDSEREQTIQLVDKMQNAIENEEFRCVLRNMSNSLNSMGARAHADKRGPGLTSVFPSMLPQFGVPPPNISFPPPLPDVSRPPPFIDTSVPPPNMRPHFAAAPSMLQPPSHQMMPCFSGPPPLLPPPPPGLPPPSGNGFCSPFAGVGMGSRRTPFPPNRNGLGVWHPRGNGTPQQMQQRGRINTAGTRHGRTTLLNMRADSISP